MTKNERLIMIEMLQALSTLSFAFEKVIPLIPEPHHKANAQKWNDMAFENIATAIDLVGKEWGGHE